MWLIVGLGNPGPQYEHTRHNVGFMVVDRLLSRVVGPAYQAAFSGLAAKTESRSQSICILKPQVYMNRSGESVQKAAQFYKIDPAHIVVVHDELDIPFGEIRVKQGGGNGGHNGLKDITRVLGPDYFRIRVGIGRPSFKGSEADYVLSNYPKSQSADLGLQVEMACDVIDTLLADGLVAAQTQFNRKSPLANLK